jgi:hypothetical protein
LRLSGCVFSPLGIRGWSEKPLRTADVTAQSQRSRGPRAHTDAAAFPKITLASPPDVPGSRLRSRPILCGPRRGMASHFGGVFDRQMKIAVRLLDAVHFRCLNARGTRLTVQKALPLFNVFVDITNRLVWYRCRWVRAWGSRPSRRPAPVLACRHTPGCSSVCRFER